MEEMEEKVTELEEGMEMEWKGMKMEQEGEGGWGQRKRRMRRMKGKGREVEEEQGEKRGWRRRMGMEQNGDGDGGRRGNRGTGYPRHCSLLPTPGWVSQNSQHSQNSPIPNPQADSTYVRRGG